MLRILSEIDKEDLRQNLKVQGNVALIEDNILVDYPERTKINSGSALHGDTYIHAEGGLIIGSRVHIGRGLTIFTSNHNFHSKKSIPYDGMTILKPVLIKDFVWIGANVSITPGITIEEGVIVGMGAVVTKDIPQCAIVGGNPAQIIGHRDASLFERLKAEGKFF